MPTIADLERLEALVANLRDLAGKQRGELIEADAWNRLVTAVIDIGRATIEDSSDEVASHKHTDQVSLEWLDPKLRAQILEGGANPASAAQIGKLERQLVKFGQVLDEFSDRLTRIQADVSGVATRDVERETSVGTALRKLDGVFDARDDVASLRGSLRVIEGQVRTAVDLSTRLQDGDGEDIDFNSLARRITSLEAIDTRLTLPDGNSFDADGYARDLAQLRAELVTEAELAEALDNIETNFSGDLRGELLDSARRAALEANADALDALGTELRTDQQAGIRGLEASVDGRIATATGDLRSQILSAAREEQTGLLNTRLERFETTQLTEVDRRIATLNDSVTNSIDKLTETVRDDVAKTVSADLDAQLAGFDERVAGVESAETALSERMAGLIRSVNTTAARIETVNRDLLAADSRLNAQLSDRIKGIEAELDERIKNASDALRVAVRAERDGEMAVLREQLTTDMTRTVRDVTRTEVSMASNRLRGEMTEVVQAEIRSETEAISAELRETAAVSDAQLAGLVSAEVRRQTNDLDTRINVALDERNRTINRDVDPVIFQPVVRP